MSDPRLHDREYLSDRYVRKQRSLAQMAEELGVSKESVRLALMGERIPLRPQGWKPPQRSAPKQKSGQISASQAAWRHRAGRGKR